MITVKKIVRMIKKPTVLILCVIILLSFVCCGKDTYVIKDIEPEYSDGTKVREGLNVVIVDGIRYYTECAEPPVCFDDIISGISW